MHIHYLGRFGFRTTITGSQEKTPLLPLGINMDASLEAQAKALSSGIVGHEDDNGARDIAQAQSKAWERDKIFRGFFVFML